MNQEIIDSLCDDYCNEIREMLFSNNLFSDNFAIESCKNRLKRIITILDGKMIVKTNEIVLWEKINNYPDVTLDYVLSNPDKIWNWFSITRHPNLTIDIIKKYPTLNWDWHYISLYLNITVKDVLENINFKWDWVKLGCNRLLLMDFIFTQTVEKNAIRLIMERNYGHNISFETLIKNLDKPLDSCGVFKNINKIFNDDNSDSSFNRNFVDNLDNFFEWSYITNSTPIEHIINNPQKPWGNFSINPNITLKFIKKNLDRKWNWNMVLYCGLENDYINYVNKKLKIIIMTKILSKKMVLKNSYRKNGF